MLSTHRNESSLPATVSGPRPGDFPVGSVESRAAARRMFERQGQEIQTRIVHHGPNDSLSDEPVGEALLNGRVYEVYGKQGEVLYKKTGTTPLPAIHLPRAKITVHIRNVGG